MYQFPQQAAGAAMTGFTGRALPAAAAGLAVALAATALTGVVAGARWWGLVVLTTAIVAAAGVLLRWLRISPVTVAVGQLAALLGLVTAAFTTSGWLIVLPGPAAMGQLGALLGGAAQQIRVGLPPVPQTPELLCLVVIAIGLVAVAVHALAVSAGAPACSGLVLLGVVTLPAVLSDRLLPWWSFVLSALGFALLLAVDSRRRQLAWGDCAGPAGKVGPAGKAGPPRNIGAAPAAAAVAAGAIVAALLVGATATAVGTGRLTAGIGNGQPGTGIGLNPFTSLHGQLNSGDAVPLFRVRGLAQRTYLRALTLSRFTTELGWQRGRLDGAVPAGDERSERLPLPAGVAIPVSGTTIQVQIEPLNYVDTWLPSFGYPLALTGIGPDWNYDPDALTIFSDRRQRAQAYTELGVLPAADPRLLRAPAPAAGAPFTPVDPRYLDTGGVDQRVVALASRVTAGSPTGFDATVALSRWFTQRSNGFRYDLRTVPGNSGDALVDFLFTGRRGYCEQFASAMAIMLRTLHVPARVAVGFTPGTVTGGSRLITTDDAHAWVEAWFPGAGWLPFDPTPLSDGRTVVPGYVTSVPVPVPVPSGGAPQAAGPPEPGASTPAPDALTAAPPHPVSDDPRAGSSAGRRAGGGIGVGTRFGLGFTGLLVLGLLAGITPLGVREGRRRWRLHLVDAGGSQAISAAWEEVLAESADRGVEPCAGESVRATAQRLAHEHALDDPGQAGLRTLVGAVEQSWYARVGPRPSKTSASKTSQSGTVTPDAGNELRTAVDAVRASLARCAPTTRSARLLPRSVLRWRP